MTPRSTAFVSAFVVVLVDQLTKWWVVSALPGEPIVVISDFLAFRYVRNTGAAFSLLPNSGVFLAVAAIGAAVFIVVVVGKTDRTAEGLALGLVLGGALGNLTDRVFRGDGFLDGAVVDFIDFDFFPAFNIADGAITIGAGLALLLAFAGNAQRSTTRTGG